MLFCVLPDSNINKNVFCKNTPYRSEIESKSRGISLNTTKYHGFCGVCKVRRHEQLFLYSRGVMPTCLLKSLWKLLLSATPTKV